MIFHGSRWVFMVFRGSMLVVHGFRLVFHGSSGFSGFYGSRLVFMAPNRFSWFFMFLGCFIHGSRSVFMVFHGSRFVFLFSC